MLLAMCFHKASSQDLIADPFFKKYEIPKIPTEPIKLNKDTLGIQLGVGVNVTQLFRQQFGATDLVYANFDFVWQKDDILFKHFFLSVYNEIDSSQSAIMMQGLSYKHIGAALGVESTLQGGLANSAMLVGPCFMNHFLSVGMFYKTDETIEAATRFIYNYGNAQLSVVGTYNFQYESSFLLLSIVRVFQIK